MKMKKSRLVQAAIVLIIILGIVFIPKWSTLFSEEEPLQKYSVTYMDAFDTVTEIIAYCESEEEFNEKAELLHKRMLTYHSYFDIYNSYPGITNLKTINDMAGKGPVKVNEEIITLLSKGKDIFEVTNGQVNITMGATLKIWEYYRVKGNQFSQSAQLPEMSALVSAEKYSKINNLVIDKNALTVELKHPNTLLNVGSIAKGYAADLLREYAIELGFEHILISLGGNIVTVGDKPDGTKWTVGIQNPFYDEKNGDTKQYIKDIQIKDLSVVTSGDYQRYYTVNGERYCHIIDPDTLMPATEFASVTVVGPNSLAADILSTALFVMSLEDGQKLMESMDGYEAMWITTTHNIHYTDGFK